MLEDYRGETPDRERKRERKQERAGEDPVSRDPVTATIRTPVNTHGAMTVEVVETNENRQIVDYEEGLRSKLAVLPVGTSLPIVLERLPERGNCWRVTAIGTPGRAASPSAGPH